MPRQDPAVLREVTVSLPFGIGSASWKADPTERHAAWELYIELVTRVAVQSLSTDTGTLREAMNSLYTLFGSTREILRKAGPAVGASHDSVGGIAIAVLNHGLRPFLSKWHPLLQEWESKKTPDLSHQSHEKAWDQEPILQQELETLRLALEQYANVMSIIAGVDNGVNDVKGEKQFDVFLCHNSSEKDAVERIRDELMSLGISSWMDKYDLEPFRPWSEQLKDVVSQVKAVAIFIGSSGITPLEQIEIQEFLKESEHREIRMGVVILPGYSDSFINDLPSRIKKNHWVDFRQEHPDPMRQLIWGITSSKDNNDVKKNLNNSSLQEENKTDSVLVWTS